MSFAYSTVNSDFLNLLIIQSNFWLPQKNAGGNLPSSFKSPADIFEQISIPIGRFDKSDFTEAVEKSLLFCMYYNFFYTGYNSKVIWQH